MPGGLRQVKAILVSICLVAAAPAFGQRLALGVKGGVRATDDFLSGSATSESKRYVVGPMVEVLLPYRLGVEVNALYRRFGYRTGRSDIFGSFAERHRGNSWEFPMLLKYRFAGRLYASGGYAPRTINGSGRTDIVELDFAGNPRLSTFRSDFDYVSHGAVVGAGIELGSERVRFSPEFRYTRWKDKAIDIQGSRGFMVQSNQNQMDVLLSITWGR